MKTPQTIEEVLQWLVDYNFMKYDEFDTKWLCAPVPDDWHDQLLIILDVVAREGPGPYRVRVERTDAPSRAEVLEFGIKEFLAADGHDLCHVNRAKLASLVGIDMGYPALPPEAEFARRCDEYRQQLYGVDQKGEPHA